MCRLLQYKDSIKKQIHETVSAGEGLKSVTVACGEGYEDVAVQLKRPHTQLSEKQIQEVVDGYEAGLSMGELGRRFGCHYTTIGAHLRRCGVEIR
jgi:DNA-directed RNA polymerase specialized sigma24 family protein